MKAIEAPQGGKTSFKKGHIMATTLTIRDETAGGEMLGELAVELLTERITVRELIRSRVFQEVKDYNRKKSGVFRGLIQPTDAEKTLNGYKVGRTKQIDWQKQFDAAVAAFEGNGVIILIDDKQATDLDEEITVMPETQVSFLKLVPLVGG